jgi:DNA-directed RNA polymerase subunit beta'
MPTCASRHSISPFFLPQALFRNREIATGASAIREQLADLDLRIILL